MFPIQDRSQMHSNALIGVGVDVIHLRRLAKAIKRNPRFFDRLANPKEHPEWTAYDSLGLLWSGYLWTGKEAVAKALKTGVWREGIDWPDLSVGHHLSSFQALKAYFTPWKDLLFKSAHSSLTPSSLTPSSLTISSLNSLSSTPSSLTTSSLSSVSLYDPSLFDSPVLGAENTHTLPTWISGSVSLQGPALHQRTHIQFSHAFTLIESNPLTRLTSDSISNSSSSRVDQSQETDVNRSLDLTEYQALSIVYAWK